MSFPNPRAGIVAQPVVLVDPATGLAVAPSGGSGGSSGPEVATVVTEGATVLAPGVAHDVVAASGSAVGVEFYNRGANDATYRVGAVATGATTERTIRAGESKRLPYATALQVSFFSANGTTIEWETWQ